jgi:hypothetical protein
MPGGPIGGTMFGMGMPYGFIIIPGVASWGRPYGAMRYWGIGAVAEYAAYYPPYGIYGTIIPPGMPT